jgi:Carbohydrate binding module (family 6)
MGWTRPGGWLIYTVDVKESGTYHIDMRVACKGPGGAFRLEFNGVDRTGPITVPDTGGWEHLKPFSNEGVKLVAGRQVMKVVMFRQGDVVFEIVRQLCGRMGESQPNPIVTMVLENLKSRLRFTVVLENRAPFLRLL